MSDDGKSGSFKRRYLTVSLNEPLPVEEIIGEVPLRYEDVIPSRQYDADLLLDLRAAWRTLSLQQVDALRDRVVGVPVLVTATRWGLTPGRVSQVASEAARDLRTLMMAA
jgi:hypothetical protein